MKSPYTDIEKAFDPMFDEHVVITCNGGLRQTIYVIVDEDMGDEPLSDQMVDTNMEAISITCKESDWSLLQKVKIGDIVERSESNNKKYKVISVVRNHQIGITIKARSFTK